MNDQRRTTMPRIMMLLLLSVGSFSITHAQSCLPQGITLNQQWEVNAFPNNYPGCTQIDGFLKIGLSNDITDLTPLAQITSVGGFLLIEWNVELQTLAGLDNITSIGGDLTIENNMDLSDLSALGDLTSVGGDLEFRLNGSLASLHGLGSVVSVGGRLSIRSCSDLTDLQGLEGLVDIGGGLSIENNSGLVSLNGLAPVNALGGALWVKGNPVLADLTAAIGLTSVGAQLNLEDNPSLASVEELSGITQLGGYLRVQGMPLLTDLSPLVGIDPESITQLVLQDLPGVSSCALANICGYLALPGADAVITENAVGCASVAEVEAACNITVGLNEAAGTSLLHLFPNPTHGQVTVEFPANGIVRIRVLDPVGREVMAANSAGDGHVRHTLHLAHLSTGAYLVEVRSEQGITTARLIIE